MCSFFFLMIRPPPRSTPFPYPTLFPSNIRLASQLTGWDLNVMTESDAEAKSETESKELGQNLDRKSTRLNSSHFEISNAVSCLKKKQKHHEREYFDVALYSASTETQRL